MKTANPDDQNAVCITRMVETSTQMIFLYQGIQATQLEQDVISELESILGQSVGLDDDLVSEGGIDSFGIMQMFAYF